MVFLRFFFAFLYTVCNRNIKKRNIGAARFWVKNESWYWIMTFHRAEITIFSHNSWTICFSILLFCIKRCLYENRRNNMREMHHIVLLVIIPFFQADIYTLSILKVSSSKATSNYCNPNPLSVTEDDRFCRLNYHL